jgi:hypothetical protein
MVMSATEDTNGTYAKFIPNSFIHNAYTEPQVEKFWQRQKLAIDHLQNPWSVLLIDDCMDNPSYFKKPLQLKLYKNGRHRKMLYILSLQYCMDVIPSIRANTDGVFILREPNIQNRERLYKNYAGIIPSFELFCEIMDQITVDYTALYIHNTGNTNNWQDCVFWYKAQGYKHSDGEIYPYPEGFKFGSPTLWDHHYQRYNPEYTDPI